MPNDIELIPFAAPWIGEEEMEAVARVMKSGWISQGPETELFEAEFAEFVGARHAVATSSCTTAMEAVLYALGIKRGDEVITVSHSFVATANVIWRVGATPVFVDIDPITLNICPHAAAAAITPKTVAILAVHQLGMPCEIPAIRELCNRSGIALVEDAACAAGSMYKDKDTWRYAGFPSGEAVCFSFHPRKLITTGDGGMITTNDTSLANRLKRLRVHGVEFDAVERSKTGSLTETYIEPGFNMRMTDIQSAIGRVQLRKLPQIVMRRRCSADYYFRSLHGIPGIMLPVEPEYARSNWQTYRIGTTSRSFRDELAQHLLKNGVAVRGGVINIHEEPSAASLKWRVPDGGTLKASEHAKETGLQLPMFTTMTLEQITRVATILGSVRVREV